MINMFYQQFLTDKSLSILTELKKRFKFTLIGGWAVYFYTNSLKSKDIDMIVDFSQLEQFKKEFTIEKNENVKIIRRLKNFCILSPFIIMKIVFNFSF